MTETAALKFGPEWLRALSHGNAVASPPPSPGLPKYKLAEYRYGREEMLALFDKNARAPDDLLQLEGIASEKCQLPLALVSISEDEQRTWARSVNSDAVLRLMNRGSERSGPPPPPRGGRGGSTERGRGRGRGGYYQRGLSNDESNDGSPGGFPCPRPFERSQSMHERSQSWEDKERRFEKGYLDSGRSFAWRKDTDNDEGGWRTTSTRAEKWADRSSWRNNEKDEREQDVDRDRSNNRDYSVHSSNSRDGSSSTSSDKPFNQKSSRMSKTSWDCDHEGGGDQLPEWSTEDNGDVGFVGTFDSSGAFLESKLSDSGQMSGSEEEEKSKKSSSEEKEISHERLKKRSVEDDTNINRQHKGEREKVCLDNNVDHHSTANDEKQFVTQRIIEPLSRKQSVDNSNIRCKSSPPVANTRESPVPSMIKEAQTIRTCLTESDSFSHNTSNNRKASSAVQSGLSNQIQKDTKGMSGVRLVDIQANVPTPVTLQAQNLTGVLAAGSDTDKQNEEVNFDHLEKAAENLVAKWTAEDDEKAAQTSRSSALPIQHEDAFKWFYRDPQSQVQGPFSTTEMAEWFSAGYFTMTLSVRRGCDERFAQLGELIKRWGRIPFTPGPAPPPLLNTPPPVPPTMAPPTEHLQAPPIPPHLSEQEQRLYMLQQQILQQQLVQQMLQQQMFLRNQVHLQQAINNLKETEGFNNLTPVQQQQLIMQHLLLQQLQLPARPPGQEIHPEVLQQQFQRMPNIAPTPMKDGMNSWNSVIVSGGMPPWEGNAKPQPTSIWDAAGGVAPGVNPSVLQELERKIKEENERAEEERQRLIQQRLQEEEEMKRQEELKREEALKLQKEEEMRKQKEEAERLRLEEIMKEKERQLAEEQRRKLEDEQRRKEAQQRLEEEMRRKEEERKRKEERRRQEEERKKKEQLELELQRQKEAEQLKEFQRQQMELQQIEMQRQQELHRQEMLQKEILAKQQEIHRQQQLEALQKLQEKQKAERIKAQAPAWGVKLATTTNDTLSLAEIQKLQEEKERHEREERQRLLQVQQQQQAILHKQQQQQQQQQMQQSQQQEKVSAPWSRAPAAPSKHVKSLLEIQQEEAEKMSKQQKLQQQQQQQQKAQNNVCLLNAGVWGNASTHLSWANATASSPAPTKWGTENANNSVSSTGSASGGFWDEALAAATRTSRSNKPSEQPASTVQNTHVNSTVNANKAPKNTRNKKEEDAVLKIFESRTQKTDEFTQWCIQALSALQSTVDIPTFVAFLKDVESSFDVHDYVRSYLGENKEAQDFAKEFLERRSKHKNRAKKHEEENMWGPAPAINPANKNQPVQNSDDGQRGGQKKKKKNKMQKVDNSILGFTVHASIDRINVGEIEHVEGI